LGVEVIVDKSVLATAVPQVLKSQLDVEGVDSGRAHEDEGAEEADGGLLDVYRCAEALGISSAIVGAARGEREIEAGRAGGTGWGELRDRLGRAE